MPLIDVSGRKVYYEIHGEKLGGVPLVLVMGLGGSCEGWLSLQVPEFSNRHRTLIYENRGVGRSQDPGGPFTTADLADDLAGLLDALDVSRAHVLGTFMGGMTAQELALRHPERVAKLVLIGTWARPDAKRRMLLEKWQAMARADTPPEVLIRERLLWTLQDETLEQRDLLEAMRAGTPGSGLAVDAELFVRQCDACLGHDSYDRLREVRHETLVMCGRQDQLTPPRLHRELADELPNASLVTLPYGAHLVLVESAQRLNQTVLDFLVS